MSFKINASSVNNLVYIRLIQSNLTAQSRCGSDSVLTIDFLLPLYSIMIKQSLYRASCFMEISPRSNYHSDSDLMSRSRVCSIFSVNKLPSDEQL